MQFRGAALLSVSVVLLAACGKVQEAASQKIAEKAIEAAASKDGTQAKVDLSGGGMKVTTTDEKGQTSTTTYGSANVTEAELGVPFYPGATSDGNGSGSRVETPEGKMATVTLHSADAPDKVAGFYRDLLKSRAAGKQFTDMTNGDMTLLSMADEAAKAQIQVTVTKAADQGSEIQVISTRAAAPK